MESNPFPPLPPTIIEELIDNKIPYISKNLSEYYLDNAIILFDFIKNDFDKIMLTTAYAAITKLNYWEYIKNMPEEFSVCSNEINEIYKVIEDFGYDGHSGGSFIYIIKTMQYIIKHGLGKFKLNCNQ
jgi:hypothetical protein